MSRVWRAALLALVVAAVAAAPATAHQGNPNYRSVVDGVNPAQPGLQVQVLGFDNQLQLINRTGKVVVIEGYRGEPYARLLPNGTVEVNRRSPATYLNEDRFGQTVVPRFARPNAAPQWQVLDRTSRFTWHDHRMHWMSRGLPPQVHDKARRTKIFDYRIPLRVGDRPAAIRGTLFWIGTPSGFPLPAAISLAAIVLLGAAAVLYKRRRSGAMSEPRSRPAKEAW
jgi:hypothetical protein